MSLRIVARLAVVLVIGIIAARSLAFGPSISVGVVTGRRSKIVHRKNRPSKTVVLDMSRKRSALGVPTKSKALEVDKDSILWKWAWHEDASFHDFSQEDASAIRESLLTWYRVNRRMLPWRGDPPPYDGSTAGINVNNNKNGKRRKNKDVKEQPIITSFFASTKPAKSEESILGTEVHSPSVSGYSVWVSEIMLQQTRVEAVIPYYLKWMKRFPSVHDLAIASDDDVNAHWAGLGFYRRARLLHKGAKRVVDNHGGELPRDVKGLMEIDGIGRYTASAIASIAFDVCVPVVDGNVCRVLSRLRGVARNIKAPILKDDIGWKLAEQIVTSGDGKHAGEINQALMELGATYCAPSGTGMDDRDPLKEFYMSTKIGSAFSDEQKRLIQQGFSCLPVAEYMAAIENARTKGKSCKLCEPGGTELILNDLSQAFNKPDQADLCAGRIGHDAFPLAPPKTAKREEVIAVAVLSCLSISDNARKWLLVKRSKDGLLAGQWEFPSVCVWTSEGKASKERLNESLAEIPVIDACVRRKALDVVLEELSIDSQGKSLHEWIHQRGRIDVPASPLEHIFSHVRHTMWIEQVSVDDCFAADNDDDQWTSSSGKEVRWMTEDDMGLVGVTSGVKKILKAVHATLGIPLNNQKKRKQTQASSKRKNQL